jgi:hypothetical protein
MEAKYADREPDEAGSSGRQRVRRANPEPALTQRRPLVLVAGAGRLCCKNAAGGLAKANAGHSRRILPGGDIDGWADLDRLSSLHNHEP